jgi:hypothetical protein
VFWEGGVATACFVGEPPYREKVDWAEGHGVLHCGAHGPGFCQHVTRHPHTPHTPVHTHAAVSVCVIHLLLLLLLLLLPTEPGPAC